MPCHVSAAFVLRDDMDIVARGTEGGIPLQLAAVHVVGDAIGHCHLGDAALQRIQVLAMGHSELVQQYQSLRGYQLQ